ncbi:MAG TPA: peptidylprolyl isomerase [Myxococcales bacterium]|jgi:cyclophilin family peptidyl-prolyl cis-trans isomerase|nr:peptidylprolyl isomerase [Myxococcales bacterium]
MILAVLVVISTNLGNVKVQLDEKKAPATVANFLKYVKEKHYDGTVFHRVIKGFMIQGGGFDDKLHQKGATYPPIQNESGNGLKNVPGAIAMARTNDPNSATDQFFIDTHDNSFLDRPPGYAVFGKVVSGMDVVRKIEGVKTGSKPSSDGMPLSDVPMENVVIKTIRVASK